MIWIIAIVVILVVVVPLVLSAALYFMVLGFGGTSTQTPTSSLTRSTMTNGVEFTFAPMSKDTTWSDVTILLSDGYNTVTWSPRMTDLVNGTDSMWMESAAGANIGMLKVNITLVDLAGNGFVNQGDYFTLTLGVDQVFSVATSYTVTILHVPTGAVICNSTFTG